MTRPPTGKRERRKAETREALLAAASDMFRKRGFEDTYMEEIAQAAGIAVGTCYNYFERKSDLLIALVTESDRSAIAGAEAIFADLPQDPVEAICAIALHDSREALAALGKASWRQVIAATLEYPDSAFTRDYARTTEELRGLMTRCIALLQARGSLRPDLDADTMSRTVFAAKYMLFIDHVSDENAPLARHEDEVRTALRTIVEGLRPDTASDP